MATPGMPVPIHTLLLHPEGLAELTRAHTVWHASGCASPPLPVAHSASAAWCVLPTPVCCVSNPLSRYCHSPLPRWRHFSHPISLAAVAIGKRPVKLLPRHRWVGAPASHHCLLHSSFIPNLPWELDPGQAWVTQLCDPLAFPLVY